MRRGTRLRRRALPEFAQAPAPRNPVGLLLKAAEEVSPEPAGQELGAAAALILDRYVEAGYRAESDPRFEALVEQMLGEDIDWSRQG